MPLSLDLAAFLLGTLAAAFVTGVSGFAFGLLAAAIWLQVLPPAHVAALIIPYALLVQGHAVWKLRRSLIMARLWPFVLASALGVPVGIFILAWVSPVALKAAVGVLLVLFSLYNLRRPHLPSMAWAGRAGDGVVGVLNGALGAATGLAGILVVVWSGMRGWPAAEQRAVFQPVAVITFALCLLAYGGSGLIGAEVLRLFSFGLPALVVGTLAGWAVFGRLDEARFRKIVLWLLLASGLALLAASA